MSCHVRSEKQGSWLFGDTRAGGVLKLPPTGSELESGFLDSPFETSGLPLLKVKMRSLKDLIPGCQLLQVWASWSLVGLKRGVAKGGVCRKGAWSLLPLPRPPVERRAPGRVTTRFTRAHEDLVAPQILGPCGTPFADESWQSDRTVLEAAHLA